MDVHDPNHHEDAHQRRVGGTAPRRSEDQRQQGQGVLAAGPGPGRDHRGRRYGLSFRDPERTCIVVAGGPSAADFSAADFELFPVIAVNDAYRIHPRAEILYAADSAWWQAHIGPIRKAGFAGHLVTCDGYAAQRYGIERVWVEHTPGLSQRQGVLRAGGTIGNSGAQAINLATLCGARRLVLVGFDMRRLRDREHWFGDHPSGVRRESPYAEFVKGMAQMAADLDRLGFEILNASTESALPYWRKFTPDQVRAICART